MAGLPFIALKPQPAARLLGRSSPVMRLVRRIEARGGRAARRLAPCANVGDYG